MIQVFTLLCLLIPQNLLQVNDRIIIYKGNEVLTSFQVADRFIGTYKGNKSGYLQLNADGTGLYKYDVFGFAPQGCKNQAIVFEWGFMLDDNRQIVQFDREYGKSYPILLSSKSKTYFKGCRERVLLDFILEYKDGTLGVSSSDNWQKK